MEHSFSIIMKAKKHVRQLSFSNDSHDQVLFEGSHRSPPGDTLGHLHELIERLSIACRYPVRNHSLR